MSPAPSQSLGPVYLRHNFRQSKKGRDETTATGNKGCGGALAWNRIEERKSDRTRWPAGIKNSPRRPRCSITDRGHTEYAKVKVPQKRFDLHNCPAILLFHQTLPCYLQPVFDFVTALFRVLVIFRRFIGAKQNLMKPRISKERTTQWIAEWTKSGSPNIEKKNEIQEQTESNWRERRKLTRESSNEFRF